MRETINRYFTCFSTCLSTGSGLADLMVFFIGLCIGSFGGMVAARLPAGEPFGGRSNCPSCRQTLGPRELMPVLSYLVQKGRCKHCGEKISPAYITVELSTAIAFLVLYKRFGLGPAGVLHMIVALHLCILAGTDIMYGLLPNRILLSASGFALILRLAQVWPIQGWASLIDGFCGACFGFGSLFAVALMKPGAMGGGDVKMAGVIGLYLGFPKILSGLALGFTMSAVYSIPLLLLGRLKATDTIPLGVFLAFGTIWAVAA